VPKIVDHDARRAAIVDTYLGLVVRGGLASATTRAIATELNIAMGSIWYYFDDLEALVSAARETVLDRAQRRVEERCRGLEGLTKFVTALGDILPLDELSRSEAIVFVNFWGRPAPDSHPRVSPRPENSSWYAILRASLLEARELGELAETCPLDELTGIVLSLVLGQQLQCVIDQATVDGRQLLMGALRPWLTEKGRSLNEVSALLGMSPTLH
jgi:AcrR family transcriptional regulator